MASPPMPTRSAVGLDHTQLAIAERGAACEQAVERGQARLAPEKR
jgi:hypothetical protein